MAATSKMSTVFDAIKQTRVFSGPINVNSKFLLGTHDGSFHCDEAMALSFLKILPEYRDSEILRTRKPDLLAQCHVVVDVGAIFDPATHRYDHHQREFTGVLEGYNTKLSSAGLVYQHFGRQVLREVLATEVPPSEEFVEICFHKLYRGFVEHLDAIDNGISVSDEKPRYYILILQQHEYWSSDNILCLFLYFLAGILSFSLMIYLNAALGLMILTVSPY